MLWGGLIPSVKDSNYSDPFSISGASSDVRTPPPSSRSLPLRPPVLVPACLLSSLLGSRRILICVHVCIQLCTHVYTVVYTRVHRGAHYYFVWGLLSALQLAFSRHRPYVLINNVPACEAGGDLRCDLELW